MKTWKDIPDGDSFKGSSLVCPLCGDPQHLTKAETLRCSQTRRKAFAELDALVAKLSTKKPPA